MIIGYCHIKPTRGKAHDVYAALEEFVNKYNQADLELYPLVTEDSLIMKIDAETSKIFDEVVKKVEDFEGVVEAKAMKGARF